MASPAVGIGIWEELAKLLEEGVRIGGRMVGVILIWEDFLGGGSVPPIEGPEADAEVAEVEEDVVVVFFGIR